MSIDRLAMSWIALATAVTLMGGPSIETAQAQCQPVPRQKLLASDGSSADLFGSAVAVAGDIAVVGAWGHDAPASFTGAAYVFERSHGLWTETAKLTAIGGGWKDQFGRSVATDGALVIVGEPGNDDVCPWDPVCDSGAAYIFDSINGQWSLVAKLTASDAEEGDRFGQSVAIAGDLVVVGARLDDDVCPWDPKCDSGSVYIFERSGSTWVETAKIAPAGIEKGDWFGEAVVLSGRTLVIGARLADDACPLNPECNSGVVYVFEKLNGIWRETAKLSARDGEAADFFGRSIAMAGGLITVGSPNDDDLCAHDPNCNSGSAYVFEKVDGAWKETVKLTASDAESPDHFGTSVAVLGDIVIIGVPADDDALPSNPHCNSGAIYLYRRSLEGWTELLKVSAPDSVCTQSFGSALDADAGSVIIGAEYDATNGFGAGAAYVVSLDCASGSHAELVGFEVLTGDHLAGGLAELDASDDAALVARSRRGASGADPNVMELVILAVTEVVSPVDLDLLIESRLDTPGGVARVRLRNWTSDELEEVAAFGLGLADDAAVISGIDAAERVRASDGRIELSIRHVVVAAFSPLGFDSFVDVIRLTVN